MSTKITNAWVWSLKRSPLLALWRSFRSLIRPNRDAFALLDAAGLPEQVDRVIRVTITRTKLWRDERAQIARELIAHAQDAMEAGHGPDSIAERFGDPRRVARLLRRSMKRKRPVVWQAYRYSRRALGVAMVMLVIGYGWLAVRFYTGKPSISVNYAAQLDARNQSFSDEQKSWPAIAEFGLAWSRVVHTLKPQQTAEFHGVPYDEYAAGWTLLPEIEADHPDYAAMAETVRSFEPELARARELAQRPVFGIPIGYELVETEWEGGTYTTGIIPASPDEMADRSLIYALLPHLGPARQIANLLCFDARLAMREGDSDRAIENYIAVFHLARQCNSEPFLISRLVGIAIHELCMNEVQWAVREYQASLTLEQLARIAHTHSLVGGSNDMGLRTERFVFKDFLQRMYTDDGHGNGHVTAEGFAWLRSLGYEPSKSSADLMDAVEEHAGLRSATMPLGLMFSNDRATEATLHREIMDRLEYVLERGPEWVTLVQQVEHEIEGEAAKSISNPLRRSLVSTLMPALGRTTLRAFIYQQSRDSFSLMLAIEAYRIEHGQLPASLGVLEPSLMPSIPLDLMNPGNIIQYLPGQGGFLLYSVGSDGDDDLGVSPQKGKQGWGLVDDRNFMLRYPAKRDSVTGEILSGDSGKPVHADPQGPDGDWILIDTRPNSVSDTGAS
jgi:hypothetical protein